MRRRLLLFLAVIIVAGKAFPQTPLWQWALQVATPGNEQSWDMCTDVSGNVYICGTFDASLGTIFGFLSFGQKDGFIAKYNSSGTLQWAARIGGSGNDEIKGICIDASGNLILTGYFQGTADLDPGILSSSFYTSAGGSDGFLIKCSSSTGSLIWAVQFGGSTDDEGTKVATDGTSAFLSGYTNGGAIFYSSNSTTLAAVTTQNADNFAAAKYNSSGVVQWVAGAGSTSDDLGLDVTADANKVYFIGNYSASLTVRDASAAAVATLQSQTSNKSNVFVIAYNQNGSLAWATNASSGDDDFGNSITQDGTYLYITGGFKNNTFNLPYPSPTFTLANQGGYDIFLAAMLKSSGAYQWVSQQTGSGVSDEIAHVVHHTPAGDLVIGGGYKGILSYSVVSGPTITSGGNDDVFITAYNNTGNFLWNTSAGGGNIDRTYALESSTTGAIYVTGEHANGVSFGPITLVNAAGKNVFLAKTGCETVSNNTVSGTQTICAGTQPLVLAGSIPTPVSGTVAYQWQRSLNTTSWTPATGSNTAQNYTPSASSGTSYFRRVVFASGSCTYASNVVTVTVDQNPSLALAGSTQTLCANSVSIFAVTPTVGVGTWSVLSGGASLGSASSQTTLVSNLGAGNNVFIWKVENGVCPASIATVTIYRDLPPSPSQPGTSQTICALTATLSAATPTLGTGTWSLLSGTGTIVSPSSPSTQVTGLGTGTNVFQWRVSNGTCPSNTANIQVKRDALPTAALTGSTQTVCATTGSITANSPAIGNGLWLAPGIGATVTTPGSPTTAVGDLLAGLNTFTWTITNGVCPPSTATAAIWRDQFPSFSFAGVSQSVCGTSLTLSANLPATGTGSWSVVSGNAVFSSALNPSATATSLLPGINELQWSISNGSCPPSISTISVTAFMPPGIVSAGTSQTVCSTSATISATTPSAGNGLWSTSGSASIINASTFSTTVTGLAAGVNAFVWTAVNGVCAPSSSTVQITRLLPPGISNAGTNQTICVSGATLSANQPTAGSGQWTVLSGSATVVAAANPTSAVNILSYGDHYFVWTLSNGVCPVSSSTVIITRDAPPDLSVAGNNQTICVSTATLNGNSPVTGNGQWNTLSGGATVLNPSLPASPVSNISVGINVFSWVITNGVCPPSISSLTITRDPIPDQSVAGNNQTVCIGQATLTANNPTIGTGIWEVVSGNAIISSPNSPTSAITQLLTGINQLVWKIENGVCEPSRDTVVIQKDAQPSPAFAGANQTLCANQATITNNKPLVGNGSWLSLGIGSVQQLSDTVSTVTNLSFGPNKFVWIISNGVCNPTSDTTEVFSETPPSPASAGPDINVCAGAATLSALEPEIGNGTWTSTNQNIVISQTASATSPVTGITDGPNIFVWTIRNGSCPEISDTLIITRDVLPGTPVISTIQPVCGNTVQVQATAPVAGSAAWTIIGGAGSIEWPSQPTTAIRELSEGEITLVYSVKNGKCPHVADTLNLTVYHLPGPAIAGGDILTCHPNTLLSAVSPTTGTGVWSVLDGVGNVDEINSSSSSVSGLSIGITKLRWTVSNGICQAVSDDISVTRDSVTVFAEAGPNVVTENFEVKMSASASEGAEGTWELVSGSAEFSDKHDPSAIVSKLSTGTNIIMWTVRKGECAVSSDQVTIELKDFMIPNAITPNGDGKNDYFHITGLDNYPGVRLTIYNSWGGKVYETSDYRNDWAGAGTTGTVANDTYYYLLEIPGKSNYTGFVTVKR